MKLKLILILLLFSKLYGVEDLMKDYKSNKNVWDSLNLNFYKINQKYSCKCSPPSINYVEIIFRKKRIIKILDKINPSNTIYKNEYEQFYTIDQLFLMALSMIKENKKNIVIEYDSIYGFPKKIFYQGSRDPFDFPVKVYSKGLMKIKEKGSDPKTQK